MNRTKKEDINLRTGASIIFDRTSKSKLTQTKKGVELSCQKDTIELRRPAANQIAIKNWCKKLKYYEY